MAHARAKLTVLGRHLLVDRVLIDGWKPADAAKAMGVSRRPPTSGCAACAMRVLAGLVDRTSAPKRCRTGSSPTLWPHRRRSPRDPLWAPRLAYALRRPRSTIYGVLRRAEISRLSFIDRPTRTVVRYERERPGGAPPCRREEARAGPRGRGVGSMHGREMGAPR